MQGARAGDRSGKRRLARAWERARARAMAGAGFGPGFGAGLALLTCLAPLICRGEEPGRALFEAYCSGCHGAEAEGVNAPDITGMPRKIVARAVQGVEQMPTIELTEAEIDAITAFLATLAGR